MGLANYYNYNHNHGHWINEWMWMSQSMQWVTQQVDAQGQASLSIIFWFGYVTCPEHPKTTCLSQILKYIHYLLHSRTSGQNSWYPDTDTRDPGIPLWTCDSWPIGPWCSRLCSKLIRLWRFWQTYHRLNRLAQKYMSRYLCHAW